MTQRTRRLLSTLVWIMFACALLRAQLGTPSQYCGPNLTYATALHHDGGATGFRFFFRTSSSVPVPGAFGVQIGSREAMGNNLSPAMIGFRLGEYDEVYFREHIAEVAPGSFSVDVWFPYGLQWLGAGEQFFALTAFVDGSITPETSTAFYWKSFAGLGDTWVVGGSGFAVDPWYLAWRKVHSVRLAVELTYEEFYGPLAPPPAGAPVWIGGR